MATITYTDKATGGTVTAADMNMIKSVVNSLESRIAALENPGNITPTTPTGGTVDDTANTFGYTLASGYTLSDHEMTLNGGSTWAAATNPISVGDVAKAIGQVGVRVKAATGRNAGTALYNQTAFTAAAGFTYEKFFTELGDWSNYGLVTFENDGGTVKALIPAAANVNKALGYTIGATVSGEVRGVHNNVSTDKLRLFIGTQFIKDLEDGTNTFSVVTTGHPDTVCYLAGAASGGSSYAASIHINW